VESVATILERSADATIQDWFGRVQMEESLMAVPLSQELRCFHFAIRFPRFSGAASQFQITGRQGTDASFRG
jgi:hypothetical protein